MLDEALKSKWEAREKQILTGIDYVIENSFRLSQMHKYAHLISSLTITVFAVLAPLFIAYHADSTEVAFGFRKEFLLGASLVLTVSIGIIEGVRRTFRFDQRWYLYYGISNSLKQLRENYINDSLDYHIGSEEWKKIFRKFHLEAQNQFNLQNKTFFQIIKDSVDLAASDLQ